jgi:mono/diheme cytochrome c family protein
MWNHGGLLYVQPPHLDAAEMREIVSYYWAQPFFAGTGNAARGRRIFAAKHCAGCHSASGPGPQLSSQAGSWNGITMVAALWRHGPAMLDEMAAKKIAWPRFGAGEMTDLIAWLNSPRGGGKHQ